MSVIIKDPNSTLDYTWNWATWLNAISDTIASVTWVVASGLTEGSKTNTTTTATIWLSGGTLGTEYDVTCRITTAGGRTEDYTQTIKIVSK